MFKNLKKGALENMLFAIPKGHHDAAYLKELLNKHKEIRFVSLVGVDLGGQDTDEKIPMCEFLKDIDAFLEEGIQTDGSSVFLPEIAVLNDAKVMIKPDLNINWIIDYNFNNLDNETEMPIGTLRIPSFLIHNNKKVGSRAILKDTIKNFKEKLMENLKINSNPLDELGIESINDIEDVILTSATELEFWVQTPNDKADEESLSTSQTLKEQYWKRTQGIVRTALETTMEVIRLYGYNPEMGHKEVGGVRQKLGLNKREGHIMEQLEIDWKFDEALQAADNELFIRDLVKDIYNHHGLEVSFRAKPIEGVAGSGEHTHLGVAFKLKNGKLVNAFSHKNFKEEYMSSLAFGGLMGILKHYEVINPFITSSNDALNRLKPGFEAPVCIVSSLGESAKIPSRNRSILIGLIKDLSNPLATRFELRSPNPLSNTYLVMASSYQVMLDGITHVIKENRNTKELEIEISKPFGEEGIYLEQNRQYRSEEDVFEYYTEEERNKLFGVPPRTVLENLRNFDLYEDKLNALMIDGIFNEKIIASYKMTVLERWITELEGRILIQDMNIVRNCKKIHSSDDISDMDVVMWNRVDELRWKLMKDTVDKKSMFTKIREALAEKKYDEASDLQIETKELIAKLKELYLIYAKNQF
ncbi:glutamine synthetase [Peptostreptococcaceae bacterium AGR-M142]